MDTDKLLREHEGLAHSVAGKYRGYTGAAIGYDDLLQAARMGILRAAEDFDPSKGVKFTSYATWWIRAYVQDEIQKHGRTIRVPRQRWPSDLPDDVIRSDEDTAAALQPSPEDETASKEDLDKLRAALGKLPRQQAIVLRMRSRGVSLSVIGDQLGVSRQRVSKVEHEATEALKKELLS